MIFFVSIVLLISVIFNILTIIIINKLLVKTQIYENWILNFKTDLEKTLEEMRAIDKQGTFATSINTEGTFESDDQVGQIFKDLLSLIEKLNEKIE